MIGKLQVVPMTLRDSNRFVEIHHRHCKPVVGARFSIGAVIDGCLQGVAIVGRPVSRKLDDGITAEVTRLCVAEPAAPNACSFMYRAAWRVWAAMGGQRLVTYTLPSELGSSLRGAGFQEVARSPAWTEGKGWATRPGRAWQPIHAEGKIRWQIVTVRHQLCFEDLLKRREDHRALEELLERRDNDIPQRVAGAGEGRGCLESSDKGDLGAAPARWTSPVSSKRWPNGTDG